MQHLSGVEWKERSEHLAGRRDGVAVRRRVVENEDDPVDPTVATLQRDPSSQRLGIREPRLQLDGGNCPTVVDGHVPCTLIAPIADRNLRSDGQARTEAVPDQREQAQVGRIAERIPTWMGSYRQVESDDGADACGGHHVKPRGEAPLDATELRRRSPGRPCDRLQRQPSCEAGVPYLDSKVVDQPASPAGTSISVRLRHGTERGRCPSSVGYVATATPAGDLPATIGE